MSQENDLKNRTLSLKRTFDAPIQLVWEAWTQPEHIALWWGPKGMDVKVVQHDFSVNGQWEYVMQMPDGSNFVSEGVYLEILELQKIISTANFRPMTEGVEIQALFEKNREKTEFTFHCIHPTEEYCKQQEQMGFYNGWGSAFDRLEDFVSDVAKM